MSNKIFIDEIISIEEIGEMNTIDIEVSDNNLFFANDILTHNSGQSSSDLSIEDTSESIGLPAALDVFLAMMVSEEMERMGQVLFKFIKNRFGSLDKYRRFVVGIDRSKMRLFDLEGSAQDLNDSPVFDNTPTGKIDKNKFSEFK